MLNALVEDVATCIGCGCTDLRACVSHGQPCHWLEVDYAQGVGVCSSCPGQLEKFKREYLGGSDGQRQ